MIISTTTVAGTLLASRVQPVVTLMMHVLESPPMPSDLYQIVPSASLILFDAQLVFIL